MAGVPGHFTALEEQLQVPGCKQLLKVAGSEKAHFEFISSVALGDTVDFSCSPGPRSRGSCSTGGTGSRPKTISVRGAG